MLLQLAISDFVKRSNLFKIRPLLIVRIWSIAIIPFLSLCFTLTLVGYFFKLVVTGATTIVFRNLLISFGDRITQGRVFLISFLSTTLGIGSRFTSTIHQNFHRQKHRRVISRHHY